MHVTNGIHLGRSLLLPVGAVNSAQTLKELGDEDVWCLVFNRVMHSRGYY
jgi:hypothetical protein